MAFTQSDLDNIDRAIASGELTVRRDGREVTYRSVGELRAARDLIAKALLGSAATRPPAFGGRGYGLASFNQE